MRETVSQSHDEHAESGVPPRIRPALALLHEAFRYSVQTSGDRWEFAVQLHELSGMGLIPNDFRWLVRKGFVEHRREVTLEGEDGRSFRQSGVLSFCDATCFVLTESGVSIASGLDSQDGNTNAHSPESPRSTGALTGLPARAGAENEDHYAEHGEIPKWDIERRVLLFRGVIVKQFKWSAVNQETVLAAFEEEAWPHRIDDPLPPQLDQDSKRRLSDTIKGLNHRQKNAFLRFHGDGTGEGVTWESVNGAVVGNPATQSGSNNRG